MTTLAESRLRLRIKHVSAKAAEIFGSHTSARIYLDTPNFAVGGEVPRTFLDSAEEEQIVLLELQTHTQGGPV